MQGAEGKRALTDTHCPGSSSQSQSTSESGTERAATPLGASSLLLTAPPSPTCWPAAYPPPHHLGSRISDPPGPLLFLFQPTSLFTLPPLLPHPCPQYHLLNSPLSPSDPIPPLRLLPFFLLFFSVHHRPQSPLFTAHTIRHRSRLILILRLFRPNPLLPNHAQQCALFSYVFS
ncbi:hypothetical protein GY45DRAFT_992911 [Cubamyces sp. BRFM 1775]|nr:hypothetical protein GY45DRAFT_992911 [Cubamyces sp. BRFM 1775]